MDTVAIIYLITLVVCSLISFFMYGIDKQKAIKGLPRTKEKTLLCITVLNGAIGSFIGRIVFHHKTDKFYFSLIIILSLIPQIVIGILMLAKVI